MTVFRRTSYWVKALPLNAPPSPNMVSGMMDFSARILASSSTLRPYLSSKPVSSRSQSCIATRAESRVFGLPSVASGWVTRPYATDLSAPVRGSKCWTSCFHALKPERSGLSTKPLAWPLTAL